MYSLWCAAAFRQKKLILHLWNESTVSALCTFSITGGLCAFKFLAGMKEAKLITNEPKESCLALIQGEAKPNCKPTNEFSSDSLKNQIATNLSTHPPIFYAAHPLWVMA